MKNYERLKGLIAASFTPMFEDGRVNLSVIESYAQHLVDFKVAGVFVNGTTGESASLTLEEQKAIMKEWVRCINGRIKVIVHVGTCSQPMSMELAAYAQEIGADGIAAIAPYFFKPTCARQYVDYFAPIAASAPELPFYYYDMPTMMGFAPKMHDCLVEGKKVMPNLMGVKFTHNDFMEMADCININNGEFEVLHGFDEVLICGMSVGAVAGVGSTYNYAAPFYQGIMDAMAVNDVAKARAYQLKSIEVVKIIIKYGGGVRGGKAIMNLIGIPCGPCRLPLAPLSEAEQKEIVADLKAINFPIKEA